MYYIIMSFGYNLATAGDPSLPKNWEDLEKALKYINNTFVVKRAEKKQNSNSILLLTETEIDIATTYLPQRVQFKLNLY